MNPELTLKSYVVFMRATQSVQEIIKQDIASYGLNPSEFGALEVLYHKGRQTIQQIGEKVLLASGSMTYLIDKLEKKGLVKRAHCPEDRRVTYIEITDKGKTLMGEKFPNHQKVIEQMFDVLDEQEKEQLILLLKKIGYQASNQG
ncbi:MarR family winged helix-turn-helix transcriptional regulator [Risungbinella massiliensis]|uniref:MarR family winged helix-turn-helix transcriptional regulator n=1 Tax=Risungbinella massiliensis TaxID=1329796 RepID=UPI0005CBE915|nr:MarR family transcriptional regulator [Risungbinella massiliensis]